MSLCFDSFSCLFCCLTICLEENVSCLRNALCHVAWQCPADWFRAPGGLFVFLSVPQPINLSPTTWLRWTETNRLRLKNSQKLAFPSLNYVLNLNSDARDFFLLQTHHGRGSRNITQKHCHSWTWMDTGPWRGGDVLTAGAGCLKKNNVEVKDWQFQYFSIITSGNQCALSFSLETVAAKWLNDCRHKQSHFYLWQILFLSFFSRITKRKVPI